MSEQIYYETKVINQKPGGWEGEIVKVEVTEYTPEVLRGGYVITLQILNDRPALSKQIYFERSIPDIYLDKPAVIREAIKRFDDLISDLISQWEDPREE